MNASPSPMADFIISIISAQPPTVQANQRTIKQKNRIAQIKEEKNSAAATLAVKLLLTPVRMI